MEQVDIEKKVAKVTEIKPSDELAEESSVSDFDDTPTCPYCGSHNVYGMSRVVGYFSKIDNWNKSKKAELKRRQEGNYWSGD
ncbi:MAG: anaerobic ribonucleoside-triphosphate reductase [Asgard group archaeon]|nr:anaerobic ribonucleoside-triphosphate reductase [Asgard group archaeon]